MNSNQKKLLSEQYKNVQLKGSAPLLFAIPRPYEDNMDRDNHWFTEILRLEKKSLELKEKLKEFALQQASRCELTKAMVQKSMELRERFLHKKPPPDILL